MTQADYFDALEVRPILGRGFEPSENTGRNAHPVTVISYQMWKERFRGDPGIIVIKLGVLALLIRRCTTKKGVAF